MRSKLKYILSAMMAIVTTVLMVIIPDVAFWGGEAIMKDDTYICEATPIFAPVEPSQVAAIVANGDYISRYDYFESDTEQISRLSTEAMENFLSHNEELLETVRKQIIGESVEYQQVNSVVAVVEDRMVVLDFVTIRYLSGVTIIFEKNTLTVLGGVMCGGEDELKAIGECSEAYCSSYIKNAKVRYDTYLWRDEHAQMFCEIILTQSDPKEAEWYVED